jgi:hypothetical protein
MGKLLVYLVAFGALLFFGWDEPLRYRFMSAKEIAADKGEDDQHAHSSTTVASMRSWQPAGTSLDRAPYEVKNGIVKYSKNFDPRQAGSPTETDYRLNTKRAAGMAKESGY